MVNRLTAELAPTTYSLAPITPDHRLEAELVKRALLSPSNRANIRTGASALFDGKLIHGNDSVADCRLAHLAAYHTDIPEDIAAVLMVSKLKRQKWQRPD